MKELHAKELRESDKRWRSCLDKKVQEVEDKYKEEINELTKEWSTDRKVCTNSYKMVEYFRWLFSYYLLIEIELILILFSFGCCRS